MIFKHLKKFVKITTQIIRIIPKRKQNKNKSFHKKKIKKSYNNKIVIDKRKMKVIKKLFRKTYEQIKVQVQMKKIINKKVLKINLHKKINKIQKK